MSNLRYGTKESPRLLVHALFHKARIPSTNTKHSSACLSSHLIDNMEFLPPALRETPDRPIFRQTPGRTPNPPPVFTFFPSYELICYVQRNPSVWPIFDEYLQIRGLGRSAFPGLPRQDRETEVPAMTAEPLDGDHDDDQSDPDDSQHPIHTPQDSTRTNTHAAFEGLVPTHPNPNPPIFFSDPGSPPTLELPFLSPQKSDRPFLNPRFVMDAMLNPGAPTLLVQHDLQLSGLPGFPAGLPSPGFAPAYDTNFECPRAWIHRIALQQVADERMRPFEERQRAMGNRSGLSDRVPRPMQGIPHPIQNLVRDSEPMEAGAPRHGVGWTGRDPSIFGAVGDAGPGGSSATAGPNNPPSNLPTPLPNIRQPRTAITDISIRNIWNRQPLDATGPTPARPQIFNPRSGSRSIPLRRQTAGHLHSGPQNTRNPNTSGAPSNSSNTHSPGSADTSEFGNLQT